MAGIDKTYTDSYSEYKEFKEWADKQIVTFFNGHQECVGDWVWELKENAFADGEIPIMNTPVWLDTYLIQNCTSEFVINRLKYVYSKSAYNLAKTTDLSKILSGYEQNRKIVITHSERTKFPLHSIPFGKKMKWWLQCDANFWFHEDTKTWANMDNYPYNSNTAHISSIKAIVRHLRKQYLPSGITFTISGRYIGEEYLVKIK